MALGLVWVGLSRQSWKGLSRRGPFRFVEVRQLCWRGAVQGGVCCFQVRFVSCG